MRKHRALLLGVLIALAAYAAYAGLAFTNGPLAIALAADAPPKVEIGPYVQKVTSNGVSIMWQSNIAVFGEVKITGGETQLSKRTQRAVRLGEVRVEGLRPDTVYTYSVTLASSPKTKMEGTFRTFPAKSRPMKLVVYGDTRTRPDEHRAVVAAMDSERNVDLVFHTGDLVADGRKAESWIPEFFDPARRMMRNVPFYPVLGNHERNSQLYFDYFSLPGIERWYSLVLPDVYIAALDSTQSFEMGTDQYNWLLGDLERNKSARWKFVVMHHPTYSSGPHGAIDSSGVPKEAPIRQAQRLLPELAKRYGIAAVFAGHDHVYERSLNDGVNYVIAGGGGAPIYGGADSDQNKYRKVFYSGTHYCVITIDGEKAQMVTKTPKGKVLDRVELTVPKK